MDNATIDIRESRTEKGVYLLTIGHRSMHVTRKMLDDIEFKKQLVCGELPPGPEVHKKYKPAEEEIMAGKEV